MTRSKLLGSCMGLAAALSLAVSGVASAGHIDVETGFVPPPDGSFGPIPTCEVNPFTFGAPEGLQPFDPADGITITLTPTERELIDLAIPGFIAALQKEYEGAGPAGFMDRAAGLDWFASVTVPCIYQKVNHSEAGMDLGEGDSVDVTFTTFERVGVNLMTSIWNARNGVMAHHMAGCIRSEELRNAATANLCDTFAPLAEAVETLFKKVTKDQRD